MPFGVNLMKSQLLYRAAQGKPHSIAFMLLQQKVVMLTQLLEVLKP